MENPPQRLVSIPLRYAKNAHRIIAAKPNPVVSIPLRYAKNGDIVLSRKGGYPSFNSS